VEFHVVGEEMAQEEGFEPPTKRLTAACSTTELLLNKSVEGWYITGPQIASKSLLRTLTRPTSFAGAAYKVGGFLYCDPDECIL
jgi:hypothetical protein